MDQQAEQLLATNVEGAQRMHHMVRDLLTYSKVFENSEIPTLVCDAEHVLQQVLASLAAAIRDTGGVVTHQPLPSLRIHEVHLMQLFQNLISNSLKYRHSGRPPAIHITAEQRGSVWVFAVQDNGIGFERAYNERIFGLFKRLHAQDEYSGNGIGLALCSRIVEHYGGHIWARAEPGEGATFFFEIGASGSMASATRAVS